MPETELKYRLGNIPVGSGKKKKLYQAYLDLESEEARKLLEEVLPGAKPEEMAEARIRSIEEEIEGAEVQCYLTLKSEGGITREEKEATISRVDFERLKSRANAGEIHKERSEMELAPGITAEIDRYLGKLEGLVIMEIEFEPEEVEIEKVRDLAKGLDPEAEEVSEIKTYKNKELAKLKDLDELEARLQEGYEEIEDGASEPGDNPERKQMRQVVKIAITGGPCGGKSEVIKHLQASFGDQLTVLPEVATQLLEVPLSEGGVGVPGKDVEWSPEWQDEFQRRVVEKQLDDETLLIQIASLKEDGIKVMICDRGILDGAAYIEGGRDELLESYGLREQLCFDLYDAVIHLNSLATDNPDLYDQLKHTNPSRYEDVETARGIDERIGLAYEGHPNLIRIPASGELSRKIELCEEIVRNMGDFSDETRTDIDEIQPEERLNLELNNS